MKTCNTNPLKNTELQDWQQLREQGSPDRGRRDLDEAIHRAAINEAVREGRNLGRILNIKSVGEHRPTPKKNRVESARPNLE